MNRIFRFFAALVPVLIPVLLVSQNPQYEALYHRLSKTYTLNPDGSMDYTYTKEQQLLTYTAFHRLYGETFIVYNPDYQELKIQEAYTIMADGKKIPVPANAFNEVLPRFASRVPAWNTLREMVITHTGLERGAIIFLTYSIHTKPGFYPALMGTEILSEPEPVEQLTITVRVPSGNKLYSQVWNSSLHPTITEQNGYTVYQWAQDSISSRPEERFQSPGHCSDPMLVFSTEKGFDRILGTLTKQPAFTTAPEEPVRVLTDTLTAGKTTPAEKAFAIQETVVQDLNIFRVPDLTTGYRLHTPAQILKSNGGTPAEKALLMTDMLRSAGIQASPVLVFPSCSFDLEIGNLSNLSAWIVRADIPETGTVFLAIDQINAYSMTRLIPDHMFMTLSADGKIILEEIPGQRATIRVKGTLHPDTATILNGDLFTEFEGRANPYLTLLRSDKKASQYWAGGLSSRDIQTSQATSLTPEQAKLTFSVKGTTPFKSDAGFLFMEIPYLKNGFSGWGIPYLEQERQTAVYLPYTLSEHYEYTLTLPEGWQFLPAGTETVLRNDAGTFTFNVKQKGNQLTVTKSIEVPTARIEPERYDSWKALADQWNLPQHNQLVFRK